MCVNIYIYTCMYTAVGTGWRRVIGWLVFIGHFLQKSPVISGSFAKNDLQLKASYGSSPFCTLLWDRIYSGVYLGVLERGKVYVCVCLFAVICMV